MKTILLIAPIFYSYEKEIIEELKKQNYEVTYIPLNINNVAIRLFLKIISKFLKKFEIKCYNYFFKINLFFKAKSKKFDKIIVLSGENLSEEIILLLKNKYLIDPKDLILYLWIPMERYKIILSTYQYYSRIFSFEKRSCKKYGFTFLPNFYSNQIYNIISEQIKEKYLLFFIGQYGKERYLLKQKLKKYKFTILIYHNIFTYFIFKILKFNEYKNVKMKDLVFKTMDRTEVYKNMSNSQYLLDDADINQEGLTQRVFDSLILEKKLITTNQSIKTYDFYNKNNILVIDRDDPTISEEFLISDYEKVSEEIIKQYSIESWVKKLLEE
ncbi:hypothetical protein EGX98_02870 [Fusobacterium necrophorum]|uniref:hypothetical protein n=1 Tax=Fusobacterium necrophorum TaxID=859 RepID=UPI0008819824|nr:hypothetical protein [Fusobacterium necrophorum]AYZ73083.1 hypothetical protein EGX98_02870 [Fusobacterium necrophorum]AZW08920.1 hypothetical protein EO219_04540 [Fusobacterium necrophorum subsp. necrophorum]SDB41803.1 hypothetical protein SAMN02983009_02005 [Fusobacterium necrophorum]SQD09893.1 Uncharacterised protein [Fusobacterium necrophorum subsp. necrophorum]